MEIIVQYILSNPGVTHSIPTVFITFITDECSGCGMGHAWVTEDVYSIDQRKGGKVMIQIALITLIAYVYMFVYDVLFHFLYQK